VHNELAVPGRSARVFFTDPRKYCDCSCALWNLMCPKLSEVAGPSMGVQDNSER
jgi:hypothetical protein